MQPKPKKLLDQVRDTLRLKNYAYRTGVRLMACLRLWVKDVNFVRQQITVRDTKGDTKGNEDRVTMLLQSVAASLHATASSG
jgi:integrase